MTYSILKVVFLASSIKNMLEQNAQLCYSENPQDAIHPKETKASWRMAEPRSMQETNDDPWTSCSKGTRKASEITRVMAQSFRTQIGTLPQTKGGTIWETIITIDSLWIETHFVTKPNLTTDRAINIR